MSMSDAADLPRRSLEPTVAGAAEAAAPAVRRDWASYADVYREHHDAVLRVAWLISGDAHQAEEATAEAFARVWPHWQRGRVTDERAYLRRAAVNELRTRGRRRTAEAQLVGRRTWGVGFVGNAHDDAAQRHDLLAALARIPARQRAVLVLRFYEDLTEAATAEALGMRLGTVMSQAARGLARLRSILEDQG
jgi:RNA polymerase sigma factor (sigma-70 family)